MTREEAIELINEKLTIAEAISWDSFSWALDDKSKEALRMVVNVAKGSICAGISEMPPTQKFEVTPRNPWHKASEELPKENHYTEKTLQGVREWKESEPVLVIDTHYQKGVDYLKNGEWMKLRNNQKDCDGFPIDYLYWMEIPELPKEN